MTQPVNLTVNRVRADRDDDFASALGVNRAVVAGVQQAVQAVVPELAFAARFLPREDRVTCLGIAGFVLLLRELLPADLDRRETTRPEDHGVGADAESDLDEDYCDDAEACARRSWAEQTVDLVFETEPDPATLTRPELVLLVHLRRTRSLRPGPFGSMVDAFSSVGGANSQEGLSRRQRRSIPAAGIVDLAEQLGVLPDEAGSRATLENLVHSLIEIRHLLSATETPDATAVDRCRTMLSRGSAVLPSLGTPWARALLVYSLLHLQALDRRARGQKPQAKEPLSAALMRRRWRAFLQALFLRYDRLGAGLPEGPADPASDRMSGVTYRMASGRRILLIGPRGCGKTTLARSLAQRLGCRADDLDDLVLADFGSGRVCDVWEQYGEPSWREAEGRLLSAWLAQSEAGVMALGGGAPMVPAVQDAIEAARRRSPGLVVIYMDCEVEELRRRLAGETEDRPSLTGADPLEEIEAVLGAREVVYRAMADLIVPVAGRTVRALVDEILNQVR